MKRISKIFAVAAIIIFAATFTSNAQIYYGVKAGANIATVSAVSGMGEATSDYGYQAGICLGMKIPVVGIGVEAEALWVNNKFSFSSLGDINSTSIEVPVMASVPIFPMLPIYIKAGPSFVLSCSSEMEILGQSYEIDPIKASVGYTAGIGVKLLKFTIDVRYNGQFSSTSPFGDLATSSTYGDLSTGSVSASLGYRF